MTWLSVTTDCLTPQDRTTNTIATQIGSDIIIDESGLNWQDSVSGSEYSLSASYQYNGGTITEDLTFSLNTNNSGAGTITWSWMNGTDTCTGMSNVQLNRIQQDNNDDISKGGGGGGGGCFLQLLRFMPHSQ